MSSLTSYNPLVFVGSHLSRTSSGIIDLCHLREVSKESRDSVDRFVNGNGILQFALPRRPFECRVLCDPSVTNKLQGLFLIVRLMEMSESDRTQQLKNSVYPIYRTIYAVDILYRKFQLAEVLFSDIISPRWIPAFFPTIIREVLFF